MGSFGQLIHTKVEDLMFRMYTNAEIKSISVLKVTNDTTFDELGNVSRGGVYDLRLGVMSERQSEVCETCKQTGYHCTGHCGHIELPVPMYNPLFYAAIRKILGTMCTKCFRLQAEGYGLEALELADLVNQTLAGTRDKEAVEAVTGVDGREIKNVNYAKLFFIKKLEKKVKKFYDDVIQGDSNNTQHTSTCNIKALELQIITKFLESIKSRQYCKLCRAYMPKLSFQGSRLMKANTGYTKKKTTNTKMNEEKMKLNEEMKKINEKKMKLNEGKRKLNEGKRKIDEGKMKLNEGKRKLNEGKRKLNEGKAEFQEEMDEMDEFGKKEEEEEEEEYEEQEGKEEDEEELLPELISDTQSYITSEQARTMLRECWKKDGDILACVYPILASFNQTHPTDLFFTSLLLVMPSRMRPCNFLNGVLIEHETSTILKSIIRLSKALTFLMSLVHGTITDIPDTLTYILSEVPGATNAEKVIEKKEGLFRSNLMGKRVNYSARSVAAPDPQLSVDEVGVPMDFAVKLSYPVPVTQWNVEELRQMVINGADVYPGAVMVEDEEGKKKRLATMDRTQRQAIAKKLLTPQESHVKPTNATKIVYRHLLSGDFVLMNRQPTLHKPSIQAHRARVMPNDRVLRMPYANCKAYNADFDGDELNLHFPQNEVARSEARHLITTHNQYLTPKDGSPLAGLIQDCVVASVMLTVRDRFFTREDYQQLIITGLSHLTGRIKTLPPAVLKPKQLWTGKQVISTLLINIIPEGMVLPTFIFKTSVRVDKECKREWQGGGEAEKRREAMTDSEFVMHDGELLSGVVDKSAIGSTSHGLVHVFYDLYGGHIASQILTSINRLCVYYLKWVGHTISVKEFVTPPSVSAKRRNALNALIKRAPKEVSRRLGIPEASFRDHFERVHMSQNMKELAAIDAAYTAVLGPTTSDVTAENERGLLRRTLDNHMRMMVDTGAKGSKVNMNQMVSLFGSVAIDGKRMPLSITGKFLPSFLPYESNPRAGGYIPDRFMTGINPQSYFYLCIVGRDSLQHTAVKTADSGYLQRCLIKHLEGIHVKYDMTVRNSDGLVLQFEYGEDGLDVTKTPFLRTNQTLEVVVANYSRLVHPKALSVARSIGQKEEVDQYAKKDNYTKKRVPEQKLTREEVTTAVHMKALNALVDPGEAVGALCAQALGEPLTQMTLNTFHFAGRDELNVTLGVPRMVEILRTATKNISTPIMEVPFHPWVNKIQAQTLRMELSQVSLHQVLRSLHVSVELDRDAHNNLHRRTCIRLSFLPYSEYKHTFAITPPQVLAFTETHFLTKVLVKEIKKSFKKTKAKMCSSQFDRQKKEDEDKMKTGDNVEEATDNNEKRGNGRGGRGEENDDDDDDDDKDGGDDDGTSSNRNKKKQEQDYSENEDNNNDSDDDDDNNASKDNGRGLSEDEGIEEDREEEESPEVGIGERRRKVRVNPIEVEQRRETVLQYDPCIVDYSFDTNAQLWCEMVLMLPVSGGNYDIHSLVNHKSQTALVHSVKNLRRVFVEDKDQRLMLRTEGVNIMKMFEYEHLLDVHKLYTNNIHQVAELYGIEAAQRSIIREIRAVQSAYDIKIDFRHLTLLADYFTCEGAYKACSRQALVTCLSPLQKMSYETCTENLKRALLRGEEDHMSSPTANITVGQPIKLGTNSMHILHTIS
ncbi:hypothetical protein Pmani_015448 [Petrolisthes manimaculis]|uniref:DNA-directed RNA polymerase subunit n=1 Tax=Petrolisthes manimaculis TaxID=1843537 RepID=A0AAE1PQX1_9EUCA|nr:hypothetical protein Pmani_015448 [Petrolisthes manimaculis]